MTDSVPPAVATVTELVYMDAATSARISAALTAVNARRRAAKAPPLSRSDFLGRMLLPAVLADVEAQLVKEARAARMVLLPDEVRMATP